MKKNAVISECDKYRYSLVREWDKSKGKVLFIMLNPSTADSNQDDPTIRRCVNYAKSWEKYGGIMVGNLFAFRSRNPKDLKSVRDPVGSNNLRFLKEMIVKSSLVVCAWGNGYGGPPQYLINMTNDLYFLSLNKDGSPSHPLMLNKLEL